MRSYSQSRVKMLLKRENEIWLYSYTDLVTNLLAFFLMVLAITQANPNTAAQILDSIAKVTNPGGYPQPFDKEFANTVTQMVKDSKIRSQINFQKNIDGISLTFTGGILFDTLSAELTPDAQAVLDRFIPLLKKTPNSYRLDVGGHTDQRPITSGDQFVSNWDLSAARASAVARYLVEKGISPRRVRAIGYADTQPISKNMDENRRVVIRIGRGVGQ